MASTLASIVIPSRGGAARLPRLIRCLQEQTHADWEAIVVLDGDIDGSEALLSRVGAGLPVRAITFPENRGRVAALNAGFEAASGSVLIRCDDDLAPRVDYVARHVASHDGDAQGTVGLYRNILPDTPYARVYGLQADVAFRTAAYESPSPWRYWAGNVSVTRETWDRIGPYDRDYRAYGWEDVDWGYRLHRAGIPVVLDPTLETDHHVAATTTAVRARRAFHSGAARHLFESKHGATGLGPAVPARTGAWNRLVHATSVAASRARIDRFAPVVDAALPWLPSSVATKAVALSVEASSVAGYLHPSDVTTDL